MSEEKDKPVFDEQSLAKLLEAAYVLQEHNHRLQEMELRLEPQADLREPEQSNPAAGSSSTETSLAAPAPKDDYTQTLAQIVETQHQIQARHLELESAMSLVAERVTEIAKASGAGIGTLDGNKVRYRAAAGLMTLSAGTEVPMEKALCVASLRTGQVIRCADVNPEFLLDAEECHRRGIQSLIAVPVYHDGAIAGGLELYYAHTQAFTEQDVHTCQLMAGLVTEALARDEELNWKKSLASERALMLAALEKLKPNLAALVSTPSARDSSARAAGSATASPAPTFVCRKCGHQLVGEEQFCGKCGLPRSSDYEPPSMQSKVASLWHMQEALKQSANPTPADDVDPHSELPAVPNRSEYEKPLADSIEEEMPELFAQAQLPTDQTTELQDAVMGEHFNDAAKLDLAMPLKTTDEQEAADHPSAEATLAKPEHIINWSSASSAREFLEQLALARHPGALARFWRTRRGDIYLAVAVILVACVIRWGIWSNHSVSATGNPSVAAGQRKPAPDGDLSLFDRMLVSLGLAEAPEPVEYKGNPNTQVWVDLHTALYYCPGTDLYGKTPKGKFTTQRDAQLDEFEPAYRRACD